VSRPITLRAGHVVAAAAAVVGAFALDQATKAWALSALSTGSVIELVPTIRLELFFNPGVAFGIGADVGAPHVVGLAAVIAALLGWICVRLARGASVTGTVFLAVAAGGATGNLWDRISRAEDGPLTGHVVDFIAVDWFAVFNAADIFTTTGIALWALTSATRAPRFSAVNPAHPEKPDLRAPF
jgi:signal peptidase II